MKGTALTANMANEIALTLKKGTVMQYFSIYSINGKLSTLQPSIYFVIFWCPPVMVTFLMGTRPASITEFYSTTWACVSRAKLENELG